jgi:hypothetical protein
MDSPSSRTDPPRAAHPQRRSPHHLLGVIVRPRATLASLATRRSVRLAMVAVVVSMSLTWANMIDRLGTREQLDEPTYVGFFGYLRVGTEHRVPIFAVLGALLGLLALAILPGLARYSASSGTEPGPSSRWSTRSPSSLSCRASFFARLPRSCSVSRST